MPQNDENARKDRFFRSKLVSMKRENTKKIKLGNIQIGGQNKVLIQSMCSIKTERVDEIVSEISECVALGADIMRVSVMDEEDALALKEIMPRISCPLVADIHFDPRLALLSLDSGVSAIRLNPGNIKKKEDIVKIASECKERGIPIRIGVNAGSLDETAEGSTLAEKLVSSAKKEAKILEDIGFYDIVISLKASSVKDTIEAYEMAAEEFGYPLHLGLTEAGPKDIGLIRSAAALSPLLLEGIGDTIRISLSDSPKEEIKAAKRLLIDLGLAWGPRLISCPTCGRTQVDLLPLAKIVQEYLEGNPIDKTIAIMGCPVNGIKEAKDADIGVAGAKDSWTLFEKGKPIRTIPNNEIVEQFLKELELLKND